MASAYPNNATWNTMLWLGNDDATYKATRNLPAAKLHEIANELSPDGRTPDGDALTDVDWQTVEKNARRINHG